MVLRFLCVLTLIFFVLLDLEAQDLPPNAEAGKCYAKCNISDCDIGKKTVENLQKSILYYTGSDPKIKVKEVKIDASNWFDLYKVFKISSADTEQKVSYDEWKLVPVPVEEEIVLRIPKKIKKVPIQFIDTLTLVYEQSYFPKSCYEWKEVLCNHQITKENILELQEALEERGFLELRPQIEGMIEQSTKNALLKFQREHNLPIGNLDFITLEYLGVSIEK